MSCLTIDEFGNVVPPVNVELYMLKSVYDPSAVADDTFAMDNMVEGTDAKILTDAERTNLANQSGVNTGDQDVLGYSLATWGGNLQTSGYHPAQNAPYDGIQIANLGIRVSAVVPADGTIDTVTYFNSTGDNTTVFKVIVNGVVAHTFTCVGPYGIETGIGVAVSAGDNVAIEYGGGTAPSNGIYAMYIN